MREPLVTTPWLNMSSCSAGGGAVWCTDICPYICVDWVHGKFEVPGDSTLQLEFYDKPIQDAHCVTFTRWNRLVTHNQTHYPNLYVALKRLLCPLLINNKTCTLIPKRKKLWVRCVYMERE